MDFTSEQRIYNLYRHHDKDLLNVICGPSVEVQPEYTKEYIDDILHLLISTHKYAENECVSLPEVDPDWLNLSAKNLKKKNIYNKLNIRIENNKIIIKVIDRFNDGIDELYDFLSYLFKSNIKRENFFYWKDGIIAKNQELNSKDNAINFLYDGYNQLGIPIETIREVFKELTHMDDSIINSSVSVFSDYKIFALAFLTNEDIMLIPHIMKNSLDRFNAFDLECLNFKKKSTMKLSYIQFIQKKM